SHHGLDPQSGESFAVRPSPFPGLSRALYGPLTGLSQPDAPVHRLESKPSPPAPDRPVQAPGSKPPCDHQREVGLDVPVDGGSPHLGGKTGRKIEGDPAVHGTEIGRASCRERVWIWVAAACMQKKVVGVDDCER